MKEILFSKENDYKNFFLKILIFIGSIIWIFVMYKISSIIFILFFSLFLSVLFSPFLNKFNKRKINDFFWMLIIFIVIFLIILTIVFSIIPILVSQSLNLFNIISEQITILKKVYDTSWIEWFWLPNFIENIIIKNLDINQILNYLKDNISQISTFVWNNLSSFITSWAWIIYWVWSAIFNFIMILLFTFFIVLERKNLRKFFYAILPLKISKYIYENEKKVVDTLFVWLKWQLILWISMFIITLLWLLSLKIFWIHIPNIFTLALIAWFMEFIPYIWTIVSFFLAITLSLTVWVKAIVWVIILYLIIQQIEWNFLVPYVMGKTLSLSPFSVLVFMLIWWALFWIIWMIFTIPIICTVQIFIKPYLEKRNKENIFINK